MNSETGRPHPEIFNIDAFLDVTEMMINSDEVERALWMLDNPPSYYRMHPPQRLLAMRQHLHRQLWTPAQYKGIYKSVDWLAQDFTGAMNLLRIRMVSDEVERLNRGGITPNVMELAPGSFFLPLSMKQQGRKFTYDSISLDDTDFEFEKAENPEHNIFVAFELIEHLSDPWEIYRNYLKFDKPASSVLISTPLHSFGGGMPGWADRPLGHLRAYSPLELHQSVSAMFQGYSWECAIDNTIVMLGRR